MEDSYNRKIDYMRVSITDRCNLRCRYCMPVSMQCVEHDEILRYEEILRLCRISAELGIKTIKVTGGEPLVRLGCLDFMEKLKQIPGIEHVTLTTNGVLLREYLPELCRIGLDGINISLDTLNPEKFQEMTGSNAFADVYASLMAALDTPIPIKVNCVMIREFNFEELEDFAALAVNHKVDVRFIEVMPVGFGKEYSSVSSEDILKQLQARYPDLKQDPTKRGFGPAHYFRSQDFQGSIGFIGAVHGKFCDTCNRIRLTSEGFLKLCLYYNQGIDLKTPLRSGFSDEKMSELIRQAIHSKPKEHKFHATDAGEETKIMSQIGG